MEGCGTISNLNQLDLRLQAEIPTLVHEMENFFHYAVRYLEKSWLILVTFEGDFSLVVLYCLEILKRMIDEFDFCVIWEAVISFFFLEDIF